MSSENQNDRRGVRYELIILAVITLGAFLLRIWGLDSVPPGWRDDELINSLVISQKALDGDLALYYSDASGHEALYHSLNALMLGAVWSNCCRYPLAFSYFRDPDHSFDLSCRPPFIWIINQAW